MTEPRHFHSARKGSGSLRPFPIYPLYTQTVILSLDKPIADCFLFRPCKSREKRRECSHTNVSNTLVTRSSIPPAQTAHVRFCGRKRVHTRLRQQDRTQRLTGRNRGRFGWGCLSLPTDRFARLGNPSWPGVRTAYFATFGPWSGVLTKNAESLRNSDALMRSTVLRRRGPAGLRDPVAVSLAALMGFTVFLSCIVSTQKIECLFFSWYKISIASEASMEPRRLCLFCYNGRAMDGRFL